MEILVWLIPISFVLLSAAGLLFIWAINNKQFDDLDEHAMDLFDNEHDKGSN